MAGGLNADDLPADARARIEAQIGEQLPGRGRKRKRPSTAGSHGFGSGWCATCGVPITGEAAWKRHSGDTGHRRFELVRSPAERPGASPGQHQG